MEVVPLPVTYGSDHFAYDFDAALADAQETARQRERDRDRLQDLAEAEYMRRLCAGELSRPVTYGYGKATKSTPAGKVIDLQPPTRLTLETHRSKFEPRGQGVIDLQRKTHKRACDEVAELYGLTAEALAPMVAQLRSAGLGVAEIAEQIGASEKNVRALLAA